MFGSDLRGEQSDVVLEAGAAASPQGAGGELLTAMLAGEDGAAALPAGGVQELHGFVALAEEPLVAPLAQESPAGPQVPALGGEHVVVPGPGDLVGASSRMPAATSLSSRAVRTLRAMPSRLEVLEPGDAEKGVAQDQRRPPLPDDLEGLGDGAVTSDERRSAHGGD